MGSSLSFMLFIFGASLNAFSYMSIGPIVFSGFLYSLVYAFFRLTPAGGHWEWRMFSRVYIICFLMSGIAAVFFNQLGDSFQNFSDANSFFKRVQFWNLDELSLFELQALTEGSLAIKIWGMFYEVLSTLGFSKERYIGVLLNVCSVALSGVVTIKMVKLIFGHDLTRFNLLITFFSMCGIFWLFASIHIRDSFILLALSLMLFVWVEFFNNNISLYSAARVILVNIAIAVCLFFLRTEFVFVPVATACAAMTALLLAYSSGVTFVLFLLLFAAGAFGVLLSLGILEDLISFLNVRKDYYSALSVESNSVESLGVTIIVSQPTPIRVVLGSIYILFFPIPFWSGFQLQTVYNLFKSFNVMFMYALFPLIVLSCSKMFVLRRRCPAVIHFLFLYSIGFLLAIAGTSLETRHFGVFLPAFFLFALLPDLRVKKVRVNYIVLLSVFLIGVFAVHMAWAVLKT